MPSINKAKNEYPKDLQEAEKELLSQDDHAEQPPSDIVAFNELRSCADLVRMYKNKQLTIKPDFQRDVVWPPAAQTRFIDSLSRQLPIPSMCISFDYNTNQRLVIDGLQRMTSIIRFLQDDTWRLSKLTDIDDRLSGERVSDIKRNYPEIYNLIENTTIPITVLRCDYNKASHMEYLFTIFHRLNTGGNKLTNQEIRNCIYSGDFNSMLSECTTDKKFRKLFGLKPHKSYRFQYEEFVLRVISFSEDFESYDGNLSQFLNAYMERARKEMSMESIQDKKSCTLSTTSIIYDFITEGKPLPKLSKATLESLYVGIFRNLDHVKSLDKNKLKSGFTELRAADEFKPENLRNAITTKNKLIERMEVSVDIFSRL